MELLADMASIPAIRNVRDKTSTKPRPGTADQKETWESLTKQWNKPMARTMGRGHKTPVLHEETSFGIHFGGVLVYWSPQLEIRGLN